MFVMEASDIYKYIHITVGLGMCEDRKSQEIE